MVSVNRVLYAMTSIYITLFFAIRYIRHYKYYEQHPIYDTLLEDEDPCNPWTSSHSNEWPNPYVTYYAMRIRNSVQTLTYSYVICFFRIGMKLPNAEYNSGRLKWKPFWPIPLVNNISKCSWKKSLAMKI